MCEQVEATSAPPCSKRLTCALAVLVLLGGCGASGRGPKHGGDVGRGAEVLTQMACGSCHVIPGLPQADGKVGPSLEGFGRQQVIAGMLPNTAANLQRYLLDPQAFVPGNVMPAEHMTQQQARDAAAYLLALR
ncbi:MAG: c-type cytochrome [Tsuneonella sp.]